MKTRHGRHSGFSIPLYTLCPLWFRFPVQLHPWPIPRLRYRHSDSTQTPLADLPILLQFCPTALSSFDLLKRGAFS
jgi:hypothetical protein